MSNIYFCHIKKKKKTDVYVEIKRQVSLLWLNMSKNDFIFHVVEMGFHTDPKKLISNINQ